MKTKVVIKKPSRHLRPVEPRPPGVDVRCSCHRLLARSIADGIEFRCPRCKSRQVLTWSRIEALRGGEADMMLDAAE